MLKKTPAVPGIAIAILAAVVIFGAMLIKNKDGSDEISLDEKIGAMLIVGFRGVEVDESSKIIKDINQYNIGGAILFDYDVPSGQPGRNIENPLQTKKLIEGLKNLTGKNLFIAVDAEGGYVNRLKPGYGFYQMESAQAMGEGDGQETKLKASLLGMELDYLGFNLNFAPVVDVNINPENPIIGGIERSFSADPEKVYEHASFFIEAMKEYGIISAVKHFPGHGSSEEDSHLGLVDITETYDKDVELLPYKKLIKDGKLDMIMTAHVMNRNIDGENPATLSPVFLKEMLRGELEYGGVIISDDMQMGAIVDHFGFEEAIIRAINAGCNLLIFSNNGREYDENIAEKAVNVIKKALQEGKISEKTINESYDKIQKLKIK